MSGSVRSSGDNDVALPALGRLFEVERLGVATHILALMYLLLGLHAARRLWQLQKAASATDIDAAGDELAVRPRAPGVDTQRLFHAIASMHIALRFASFGLLSMFIVTDMEVYYPATIILFTLPEFVALSTYLLLYAQWLELFVFSHAQYMVASRRVFRRQVLVAFFFLTTALYIGLCALYTLLLIRDKTADSVVKAILYTSAFGCVLMPVLLLGASLYFNLLLLSGFTFSSERAAQRVSKMTRVLAIWTVGRFARGTILFLSIAFAWQQTLSEVYLGVTICTVLVVSEVIPLLAVLRWDSIILVLEEGDEAEEDQLDLAASEGEPIGWYMALTGSPPPSSSTCHSRAPSSYVAPAVVAPAAIPVEHDSSQVGPNVRMFSPQATMSSLSSPPIMMHASISSRSSVSASAASAASYPSRGDTPHSAEQWHSAESWAAGTSIIHVQAADASAFATEIFVRPHHPAEDTRPDGFSVLQRATYSSGGRAVVVQSYTFPIANSLEEQRLLMGELVDDLISNSSLVHPHIVPFLFAASSEPRDETDLLRRAQLDPPLCPAHDQFNVVCVVTDFVPRGSLYALLHGPQQADDAAMQSHHHASSVSAAPEPSMRMLAPGAILRMAREVAQAMVHLHSVGVIHAHLHSGTVLLDDQSRALVNDVGSRGLKQAAEVLLAKRMGHPAYMAPELLGGAHAPTPESDVYAFGVLAWEMAARAVPHESKDLATIHAAVVLRREQLRLVHEVAQAMPHAFPQLLADCCQREPQERPTFTRIVQQLEQMERALVPQQPTPTTTTIAAASSTHHHSNQ